ncbi:MAG: hypothetical protein MMC33_006236 [Icmadophila ericetorum]|nr:hypothetical protein [Icmadophila ericetorum]
MSLRQTIVAPPQRRILPRPANTLQERWLSERSTSRSENSSYSPFPFPTPVLNNKRQRSGGNRAARRHYSNEAKEEGANDIRARAANEVHSQTRGDYFLQMRDSLMGFFRGHEALSGQTLKEKGSRERGGLEPPLLPSEDKSSVSGEEGRKRLAKSLGTSKENDVSLSEPPVSAVEGLSEAPAKPPTIWKTEQQGDRKRLMKAEPKVEPKEYKIESALPASTEQAQDIDSVSSTAFQQRRGEWWHAYLNDQVYEKRREERRAKREAKSRWEAKMAKTPDSAHELDREPPLKELPSLAETPRITPASKPEELQRIIIPEVGTRQEKTWFVSTKARGNEEVRTAEEDARRRTSPESVIRFDPGELSPRQEQAVYVKSKVEREEEARRKHAARMMIDKAQIAKEIQDSRNAEKAEQVRKAEKARIGPKNKRAAEGRVAIKKAWENEKTIERWLDKERPINRAARKQYFQQNIATWPKEIIEAMELRFDAIRKKRETSESLARRVPITHELRYFPLPSELETETRDSTNALPSQESTDELQKSQHRLSEGVLKPPIEDDNNAPLQREREIIIQEWPRSGSSNIPSPETGDSRGYGRKTYSERSRQIRAMESQEQDDFGDYDYRRDERRKERKKAKLARKATAAPIPIILPDFISIENLAMALRVRVEDFVGKMVELGFEKLPTDHVLDAENAGLIVAEFNYEAVMDTRATEDLVAQPPTEDKSLLPPRPPVVTIMGHVDHGKTTLLDYLRKSSVAASEHGGITQHIGAFTVPMPSGRIITFLDTPGHAAFLNMRQRGANVTDIVVLVVAADDSVKPQTIEAIKHAQNAKVPIIVAINKIDKPDSDIDRVKQDLARHNVEIEDFGGDTQVVCVSGKTGQGMNELEDALVALADILDMRADTADPAEGWILEATTRQSGRLATILVRRGIIEPGAVLVAGTTWTRVRTLKNEAGVQIPSASPGTPVEVDGWREQPEAGDEVLSAPDEQKAKSVVEFRLERAEQARMAEDVTAVNEARRALDDKRERETQINAVADPEHTDALSDASPTSPSHKLKEIFLVLKADVSGSAEALINSISSLGNSEVRPHILRSAVGPISEFDIEHAAAAKGYIVNFNLAIEPRMQQKAEAGGVGIIDENVIYRLVDAVKGKLEDLLEPLVTQHVLGEAEIAQVFEINVKGRITSAIAGCRVRNGVVSRSAKVRVLRDKEVIYDGSLSSLKNHKKDVSEMRKGNECGMGFEDGFQGFQVGDLVQCYEVRKEKRTL